MSYRSLITPLVLAAVVLTASQTLQAGKKKPTTTPAPAAADDGAAKTTKKKPAKPVPADDEDNGGEDEAEGKIAWDESIAGPFPCLIKNEAPEKWKIAMGTPSVGIINFYSAKKGFKKLGTLKTAGQSWALPKGDFLMQVCGSAGLLGVGKGAVALNLVISCAKPKESFQFYVGTNLPSSDDKESLLALKESSTNKGSRVTIDQEGWQKAEDGTPFITISED